MKLGIIGGSGLDDPRILKNFQELSIDTPYGSPSSPIISGKIDSLEVFMLSRHGRKHEITPSNINNRANIYALKKLGCTHILATTAVGSLREEIGRGHFVILSDFIDFTRHRSITFADSFKDGIKHVSLANPFSEFLRKKAMESCEEMAIPFHREGRVITIEGPRFSTKVESLMFRQWGADVINMSVAPEAILARELGMEYSAIAVSTDYDCWRDSEEPVSWELVMKIFEENSEKVKSLLVKIINKISKEEILKEDREYLKSKIRTIPDWPKPGIMFRDITTLLKDGKGMDKVAGILHDRYKEKKIDVIAGIESRGFIIGGILANRLNVPFVPIRKPGKLPSETIKEEYELEYGKDAVEIHKDAIKIGDRVLVADDLLATGGTANAACRLIEKLGGVVEECAFIIELPGLGGRRKLNRGVFSIVSFEGE